MIATRIPKYVAQTHLTLVTLAKVKKPVLRLSVSITGHPPFADGFVVACFRSETWWWHETLESAYAHFRTLEQESNDADKDPMD